MKKLLLTAYLLVSHVYAMEQGDASKEQGSVNDQDAATHNANDHHIKDLAIDELITRDLVNPIWQSQAPIHRSGSEERYELKEGTGNDLLNSYLVIINGPEGRMGFHEYIESKNNGKKTWKRSKITLHNGTAVEYEEETSDNPRPMTLRYALIDPLMESPVETLSMKGK